MKASETKMEEFLSASKTQFVIPVYQRNYDWTKLECKQLFNDILLSGSHTNISSHFIGSIVHVHDDVYSSNRMKELTIIDGQQRLTTITLIYLSLFVFANRIGRNDLVDEIKETYLINKFALEDDKLKLKLTENNDKALKFILRNNNDEVFDIHTNIIENFNYFKSLINDNNFEFVLNGLSKLMFVEVALERYKDDPQRIFESLNSTGLELTQADLIRNYILMDLNRKEQNEVYENYWRIIEKNATDISTNTSKVSDFIRDYLTLENKKIPNKGKVYQEFKNKYQDMSLEQWQTALDNIKSLVIHYGKLINPQNEKDKDIQQQLYYINRLEINVAFPFLMKVYDDYNKYIIDKMTFISILELVQSYTWRRFIAGLPTNSLNKTFMSLYDKVDKNNYLQSLQISLVSKTGGQKFPKNNEVLEALKIKDVYNINSRNRTYLLERLENFNNNEAVLIDGNSHITVEHIFPQNPDSKWKQELSPEEFNYIKNNLLNTLANLTLSGNNGKLSNRAFADKRDLEDYGYRASRLWLNKYLSELDTWNKETIEKRFEIISHRFFKIWQMPNVILKEEEVELSEVNIFDADDPTGRKLEYAIFLGEKIEEKDLVQLYLLVMKYLFELNPVLFATSELAKKVNLTRIGEENTLRQSLKLNEDYAIEGNFSNKSKFDLLKLALNIFDLEDELSIKYIA